jgi:DNA-directed RNA polymerase beta' subunit
MLNKYKPASKVIGIQFSMLSPEEIRKNSVAHITSRDTYINNKPVVGGLFDPRMGVLEPGLICPTDGFTYVDTPGYFGHIDLARPVFFIQHIKDIIKIAQCVCFKCSKLLINKKQYTYLLERSAEERWKMVQTLAKRIKRCGDDIDDGCGCKQPDKVRLENMASIYAEWELDKGEPDGKVRLTPEIILKIFKRISDEDIHFMGFSPLWSRPEWMVCQVLPVPPPAVRPSVKHDAQQRSEDDLTHIYSNIIKTNNDLLEKISNNSASTVIEVLTTFLQYYIAMIVNNKVKGAVPLAQRSGRPLQCIAGRLNSKSGRIRGNLMGKRVDFSARSVITGDPNLSIRQLGVPLKIAKNITKPITVNDRNRDFLLKLVQNGPDEYPGAKILEKKNGESISLRYIDRRSVQLENGDVVHRHMMDGDAILFNRQPSLHRMSMMCHIVKVMMVGDSFRMNVAVTKPYNADFDGDEMNMHMSQNVLAETELRHLAAIPYQMISPANNAPIIGIFQDSLLGAYRFTRPNISFTQREAMNLLMMYSHVNTEELRKAGKKVTNFDILSQILPPMTLLYKTKLFNDENEQYKSSNNVLEIRNGKYIRGQMEKSVLGSTTKGIIHRIFNDFGEMSAANFIDDLQNIVTEYMKSSSYSVGISDLIADANTAKSIIDIITEKKQEVKNLMDKVHMGIFENNTAKANMEEFESKINNILNKASEQSGNIALSSLDPNNRFLMIVNSGSKGNPVNITQMLSCLGQTNVDGKRIPYGFENRSLPHFSKFDDTPNARGFIENSYISGLTAPELFFHAMGGRIGLIDTACKSVTWETPIVFIENGKPIYIEIGKWIDERLARSPERVEHYIERQMELLNIGAEEEIYIPTTDSKGVVSWGPLTAITRHDPGNELYEIKTHGGRKVIVTESKSLLIWNTETSEFEEKSTTDIKVGDSVPVTAELESPPVVLEYIYMTENSRFELNEENGIFIGVFLAKGKIASHRDKNNRKIVFSEHSDENIISFINYWFKQHNEPVLLDFLISILYNNNTLSKIVPTQSFIGPDEFVIGLLNGYYSENGIISENSIEVSSSSLRLLEGISMLSSRLGIFGSIETIENDYEDEDEQPTYRFVISAQWAQKFSDMVTLLEENKQEKMKSKKWSHSHRIFKKVNNVVLDKIVEINPIDVKDHPKVYDLTIPSTLNFGLANGLQVRDTSQTGYIQRCLIKGLEDLKVEYDMTVRNNKGKIVQFSYGEDSFDSTRGENQSVPLVGMTTEDIYLYYDLAGITNKDTALLNIFNKGTIQRIHKQEKETKQKCMKYIDTMIKARKDFVESVFNNLNNNNVVIPVSFQNIITNIQGQLNLNSNSIVDITPLEFFNLVEEYFEKLKQTKYIEPTLLFESLYYFYITPKELLMNKRFHRNAVILLLETVILKYKQSIVHPGEMVGVIAGQSTGEPVTQLTLNTFHFSGVASKSNVTRGVPRINEILHLTEKTKNPSLTVFLKPHHETDQEKTNQLSKMLEYTKLKDIVRTVQICFDPNDTATLIHEDELLMTKYFEFENLMKECGESIEETTPKSKWVIRLHLDAESMLDKNITMDDIHFAIRNSHGSNLKCIYSDYNSSDLIFRIRLNAGMLNKSKKRAVESLDQTDEIYLLRNFQDNLLNGIVLRGVQGIKNVIPRKLQKTIIKEEGKYTRRDTWILDTTGTNLMKVMALDMIDPYRTISNDIMEVFNVLGIEAARQTIYNEFVDVMEFSSVYINYHHLSLLCDRMTSTKNMVSIFRYGILSDDIGPITKSTFEVQTEVLLKASRHAELDHMRGVSANVMLGQMGVFGTGAFQILLDIEKMKKMEDVEVDIRDDAKEIESLFGKVSLTDKAGACSKLSVEIRNNLGAIKEMDMGDCDDGYELDI